MTYYEELGVPPDASPDTIRDAYRNAARVLHPDVQTNPILKDSAEAQMKRINQVYATLSNAARRRRYDQTLIEPPDRTTAIIIQAAALPESLQRGNSGTYVWLAATAICAVFIIWLASRESSAPAVYPQPASFRSAGASAPVPPQPSAFRRAAQAILPRSGASQQRDDEIARLRAELAVANAERERLNTQIATLHGERKFQPPPQTAPAWSRPPERVVQNSPSLTPAPLPVGAPPLELPLPSPLLPRAEPPPPAAKNTVSETPGPRWAGSWTYNPPRLESKNRALYPPEFIETVITEDHGRIHGHYHARFKVTTAGVSPDVDFRFEGGVSGTSGRFPWIGTGGAQGEVRIRLVSAATLEVVWTASNLGKSMGLASGTAELRRKN